MKGVTLATSFIDASTDRGQAHFRTMPDFAAISSENTSAPVVQTEKCTSLGSVHDHGLITTHFGQATPSQAL
ncbi:hypothetical protein P3T76_012311 [Phytophthora citrophthora]|uniref:Uncharacterized protein n=1 Tax=Phytophthora citrophthora TaxID=4793 RepID=A0AAD9LE10_9STRA|nr:hypothetical protein P3T76_012311 [Phytophthora citrophthora]